MTDYTEKPYAGWMEEVLPQMVELDPVSIGIVAIMQDGTTGTAYFNTDNVERTIMVKAILEDALIDFVTLNRDYICSILNEDDEAEP